MHSGGLIRIDSKRLVVEFMSPWAEAVDYVELPDCLFHTDRETVEAARDGAVTGEYRDVGPRHSWPDDTDWGVEALRLTIGKLLFPADNVQACYRICMSRLSDNQQLGLRLRLFVYDPVIAAIPWETALFRDEYIGRRARLPVVRYVIGDGATRFEKGPGPLRFLGVVCHPRGTQDIDAEDEKNQIKKALGSLEEKGMLECDWLVQKGISDLDDAIKGPKQYHILHFIGHGKYDAITKKGVLLFCDRDCNQHPVPVEDLVAIIRDRNVQFALLNACDSGHEAGGIAETLVRKVLPAAVGMRRRVRDDVAIDFAQYFYQALGQRVPIDAALSQARLKLSIDKKLKPQWALPILYMRASDGKVL